MIIRICLNTTLHVIGAILNKMFKSLGHCRGQLKGQEIKKMHLISVYEYITHIRLVCLLHCFELEIYKEISSGLILPGQTGATFTFACITIKPKARTMANIWTTINVCHI